MPTQEHKEKLSDEVRAWDQVNRALSRISGHEAWKEEFRGRMREPHKHHWMAWATSGQEDTIKKVLQEVRTEAVQTGQLLPTVDVALAAMGFNPDDFPVQPKAHRGPRHRNTTFALSSLSSRMRQASRDQGWRDENNAWLKARGPLLTDEQRREGMDAFFRIERGERPGDASAARALISAVDPEYWSQMLDLPHTSDGLDPRDIEALRQAAYGTPPAAEQHSLAHGHNHRRISHRAAYHYGTTKAAWEAGQAW